MGTEEVETAIFGVSETPIPMLPDRLRVRSFKRSLNFLDEV